MPTKVLISEQVGFVEDWEGNCAAFTCQKCGKVFLVTPLHLGPSGEQGYRPCPQCRASIGRVNGDRKAGGSASLEW